MLILQTLVFGPRHGHGIATTIQRTSDGTLLIDHGSLYPALQRLERAALITSDWGPTGNNRRARYYRLTRAAQKPARLGTRPSRSGETFRNTLDPLLATRSRAATLFAALLLISNLGRTAEADLADVGLEAHNLGVRKHEAGRLLEARALYERALQAWRAVYGENDVRTAAAMRHIAMVQMDTDWPDKARELLERVVEIRLEKLGPDDPETGVALAELGAAYEALGRTRKAERFYAEGVAVLSRWSQEQPLAYETALENFAFFYLGDSRYAEARPRFEQLLEARRTRLGPCHPLTLRAASDLALTQGRRPVRAAFAPGPAPGLQRLMRKKK